MHGEKDTIRMESVQCISRDRRNVTDFRRKSEQRGRQLALAYAEAQAMRILDILF
jgi:hypothetical protein